MTIANSSVLSTERWCTPTLTSNYAVFLPSICTAISASQYISITALTSESITVHSFLPQRPPDCFPWHMIKNFLQINEYYKEISKYGINWDFSRHESHLNVTDGNCTSNSSFKKILLSKTLSKIFIACSSIFKLL